MAFGTRVRFEAVREAAFGVIAAGYTAIGTATTDHTRLISIFNSTDVDVYISLDGVTNHIRMAAGSGQVFDLTTNKVCDDGLFIKKETIFYQKRVAGAPSSGAVWIQVMYADGGT
jgi:hypothetical protein